MKLRHLCVLLIALPLGCQKQADTKAASAAGWDTFGAEIVELAPGADEAEFVALDELLANPGNYEGKALLVKGSVQSVCKKKGCWMTMTGGDESMRITFKDYGFFMPLDCEGREAIVAGTFQVETTPEDMVKHYLEDEGKLEEAAAHKGDKKEFTMEATGVHMEPTEDGAE